MSLFEGEALTFFHAEQGSNLFSSPDEINEKYSKGDVRIVTEQARYPLSSITTMLSSGDYLLNPEFQRRHRWTKVQKSRLIESFIMNVPIPPVFLYEDQFGHYEVMDGLQRLTAINEFYKDKYSLEGLQEWPELNGKSYSNLPLQVKKGIDRRYLSSVILLQETAKNEYDAKKLKQLVFDRINSGGVKLEPQESRNAIYNGPFNLKCIQLSENEYFRRTWGMPVKPQSTNPKVIDDYEKELAGHSLFIEMKDVELVLRFFANRQRERLIQKSNLVDYLDNYLRYANGFNEQLIIELATVFEDTIKFMYDLLGEDSFRLFRVRNNHWSWYRKPTTAVYDPIMLVAARYLPHKDVILEKRQSIKGMLEEFFRLNYDTFEGRNTNPGIVREREERFEDFFQRLLN